MLKTLRKTGNSYAVPVDRSIMELMDITPETPLKIELNGRTLTVKPVDEAEFKATVQKINKRHHRALKRLAE